MKKLWFVVLFFIIVLGGGAFFGGWVQLTVPPGSYGIMRSKTHGVDPELIREGKFRWVWYKLIPTNVVITRYSLKPIQVSLQIEGSLPAAAAYTSLSGLTADFSYTLNGALSCTLKPEALPSLIITKNIAGEDDLRAYEKNLAEEIRNFVIQQIRSYVEDEGMLEELLGFKSASRLQNDITGAFPDLDNLSCSLYAAHLPDISLYFSVQALYKDYLERQRSLLQPEINAQADKHLASLLRLDELTKYGELLTKYPVLLEYLALENGSD
ncbi:MAG: hypothetical protein LBL19_00305 [Spirochaetaceae bacterium]|jgi:hypothetical protein|nr:hypothetical protein [Spirochaetaceae bacterium]